MYTGTSASTINNTSASRALPHSPSTVQHNEKLKTNGLNKRDTPRAHGGRRRGRRPERRGRGARGNSCRSATPGEVVVVAVVAVVESSGGGGGGGGVSSRVGGGSGSVSGNSCKSATSADMARGGRRETVVREN